MMQEAGREQKPNTDLEALAMALLEPVCGALGSRRRGVMQTI
jgi:hypothetical protein